jgi:hypothetical protein
MVKAWLAPELIVTLPLGEIEPLLPADAVIVYEVIPFWVIVTDWPARVNVPVLMEALELDEAE